MMLSFLVEEEEFCLSEEELNLRKENLSPPKCSTVCIMQSTRCAVTGSKDPRAGPGSLVGDQAWSQWDFAVVTKLRSYWEITLVYF